MSRVMMFNDVPSQISELDAASPLFSLSLLNGSPHEPHSLFSPLNLRQI